MADLSQIPSTPANSPPAATDVVLIGRPPPPGSPLGTPMTPYGIALGFFSATAAALATSNKTVSAAGTDQASATPLTPGAASIITSGSATNGVRLAAGGPQTVPILNALTTQMLAYPPLVEGTVTQINNAGNGNPVALPAGVEVLVRTEDGISWYVGGIA